MKVNICVFTLKMTIFKNLFDLLVLFVATRKLIIDYFLIVARILKWRILNDVGYYDD